MGDTRRDESWMPNWFTPEAIDTVIVALPDVYGRLMGKRMTRDFFLTDVVSSGMHLCDYLLTVDMDMAPLPGFKLASWDQGYGDLHARADLATLRLIPWQEKTAIVLADLFHPDGSHVEEAPRRLLARQVERLAKRGLSAFMGAELEFYLFDQDFRTIARKGFRAPKQASDYLIDYHILHTGRDEDVLARLRNEMAAARIPTESSKGEWGKGQYELNLLYAEAVEMADRHVLYKIGAKEIADQQGRALTFMAKWDADQAGSSCHVHSSLRDADGAKSLFFDAERSAESPLFRQFLGGLLKYTRELAYFFASTVNAYKRYQHSSWAPTKIVWGRDNRTCGFRIIGSDESLRIENRMPGADANPYLAFAATLAAGLAGVDEKLDCGDPYRGNAYEDDSLSRLPETLVEAADLLDESTLAREAFGSNVVDFYTHTARSETQAFNNAVTDWERRRYFEQI